jgi:hypothetical protein
MILEYWPRRGKPLVCASKQFEILALFPIGHYFRQKAVNLEFFDGQQVVDERIPELCAKQRTLPQLRYGFHKACWQQARFAIVRGIDSRGRFGFAGDTIQTGYDFRDGCRDPRDRRSP